MKIFITGTGTGVGKTLVTAALTHQLRAQGKQVAALKPVISGYQADDAHSDTALLLASQQLAADAVESISPWRFSAPLSPHIAAAKEGKAIDMDALVRFCKQKREAAITLVEGAGGVMAPLTDTHTTLDVMQALGWPVILVAGCYLGSLSHTLTAYETLRSRGIAVQAVVASEGKDWAMRAQENAQALKPFMKNARHIAPLPQVAPSLKLWQDVADLTWMLT